MKKLVIIPGGFHPFHAGHMALYNAAREAFPSAEIYVAATDDTAARPFSFKVKKFLAQQAGVPGNRFIQVKSPFRAQEITQHYDPKDTQLIFVRSEKDRAKPPQAGGVKKDGTAAYLQPYRRNGLEPMEQHGYMAYLPTVQFGPGMTSATEIRAKWPELTDQEKISLVTTLYPSTAGREDAAQKIRDMLDSVMGNQVQEATMKNDPESGHIIYPDGGLGGYSPDTLQSAVSRHMMDVIEKIKAGDFAAADYMLYKWGVIENKIKALKEYYDFIKKQGRRPMAADRTVDLQDYREEK